MPLLKLTRRSIAEMPAPTLRPFVTYRDTELKGFGLRHMKSGVMTFYVFYRPGGGGRKVSETAAPIGRLGVLTVEQARDRAREMLARVTLGADPSAERAERREAISLTDLSEKYMAEEVRPKSKPATYANYDNCLRLHIRPSLGGRRARDITRADVAKLHRKIGEKNAPTANRVKTLIGGIYTWASKAGELPEDFKNPARHIDAFREVARDRYLTGEELARIGDALREAETVGLPWEGDESKPKAKHLPKPENRRVVMSPFATAAIRLLMFTGCRLREILHLRWADVDLERGLLFLPDSKTGKKTVLLNAPAMTVLSALPKIGSVVVPGNDAEKPRHDLHKPWAAITRRAGLEGVRIHDLRHTFASTGAMAGMGLPMIGKLLGHAQASTTERYAHLADEPARRASESIAATIAAAMGEGLQGGEVLTMARARK